MKISNYPKSSYILSADGLTLEEWLGIESIIDLAGDNILANLQFIGDFAFNNCRSLTTIKLPPKLSAIGIGAFCLCSNLRTVIFPENLLKIGEGAFANCESLVCFNLPDSIELIDKYAFTGCVDLKSVTMPGKVTTIEIATFKDCVSLKSVILHEGVTTIKNQAFWNCQSLEEVVIPFSLKSIEDFAFIGCQSLTKLLRPDYVSIVENLKLKIDFFYTFIGDVEPDSTEWDYMWEELAKEPINSICVDPSVCLNNNEVYEYMGTFYDGEILHNFRHRCHPASDDKFYIDIKPSEAYLVEIEEFRK